MANPQKIKFRSVEDFLDHLPEQERAVTEQLRSLVLDTLPYCREKLSYNVPFYSQKGNICFIWPASVPWGNLQAGVALGFTKGHLLDPEGDHLQFDSRKAVGRMIFHSPADIDRQLVQAYLAQAELLNKDVK